MGKRNLPVRSDVTTLTIIVKFDLPVATHVLETNVVVVKIMLMWQVPVTWSQGLDQPLLLNGKYKLKV